MRLMRKERNGNGRYFITFIHAVPNCATCTADADNRAMDGDADADTCSFRFALKINEHRCLCLEKKP